MLLPDQMQKLLQDSEASVNTGAPANEEASALSEAPVPTGAHLLSGESIYGAPRM